MRTYWGRAGAIMGLLVAIFSDLRRRAWWAYRAGGLHVHAPRTTIVAPRPAERQTYVPVVTAIWRPVVARALPVEAASTWIREPGDALPVVWIDVTDRPDIADLPRVLSSERGARGNPPLLGTQWLADHATNRTVLIVTFVEPVTCTWALSFDVPRWIEVLKQIAESGELFVAWDVVLPPWAREDGGLGRATTTMPGNGLLLQIPASTQLRPILAMWAERLSAL